MEPNLTVEELQARWEKALEATRHAVAGHPTTFRQLKTLAAKIVADPIDINDYFPTVERLVECLTTMDPCGHGSIFEIFCKRIAPGSSIWQVKNLRMECQDLLVHLDVFDQWRREKSHLRIVK